MAQLKEFKFCRFYAFVQLRFLGLSRKQIYPAYSVTPGKISLREYLTYDTDACGDDTKNNYLLT